MTVLKLKQHPGVQLVASETLDLHDTEQQLRGAQYELDIKLHDLRTEFIAREGVLRKAYLERVAEISAA